MNKSIQVLPFPNIPDAYVVISGMRSNHGNGCETNMSFFYGTKKGGAEWMPDSGRFTLITPVNGSHPEAKPHWFYEYYSDDTEWAQLLVDKSQIVKYFLMGDYERVFEILKRFADDNLSIIK